MRASALFLSGVVLVVLAVGSLVYFCSIGQEVFMLRVSPGAVRFEFGFGWKGILIGAAAFCGAGCFLSSFLQTRKRAEEK